jgi:hypothetical protein
MNKSLKLCTCLMFLAILAFPAGSAWANTAANTQIFNNATLSYNDGTGVKTSNASVTVTVALVPAGPAIVPGSPPTVSYNGPATTATNSFVVTASANGPDTYNVSSVITGSTNTSGPTAVPTVSSIYLGATVTTTGSTASSIIVPADGASDGKVNGIAPNSTVIINGELRTVDTVIDNVSGTSTINLKAPALSSAPGAGVVVAEQKTVTVTVTAGTIATSGTNITVSKNLTVTSTTSGSATTTAPPPPNPGMTDTFTSGVANLTKFVRNTTVSVTGTNPFSYNGQTYYQTGVTAKPSDTLEYILVATNGGASQVTASVVADVLPTAYVALQLGVSAYGGKDVAYVDNTGATPSTSYYTAASDSDQATYTGGNSTLNVYLGTGATNSAGGIIPAGKSVYVLYQVKVN